jgi:predicted nuclease with TOPRIM domain
MTVELEVLVGYAGTVITIVAGWFGMKYGLDRANEKILEGSRQIEALWSWKDEHEKDSNGIREHLNKDISRLEGAQMVQTEQFKQIMQILEDIKERMGELENKK